MRNVSLDDFLAGRSVVQNSDVVPQRPAGAAGSSRCPLAEITKPRMRSDLQRQRHAEELTFKISSQKGLNDGGLEGQESYRSYRIIL